MNTFALFCTVAVAALLLATVEVRADVQCQDGSACPDGSTCCQLADGSYGCCPYPNADCCSDKLHCCPSGYTCDLVHSQCVQGFLSIPMSPKLAPTKPAPKANVQDVQCQDGSACPDGSTCCQLADGSYGCCPYPNADCCSDKLHCCPSGYTCDLVHSQCVQQGFASLPLSVKFESKKPKINVEDVPCGDGTSCPDGSTCCQLVDGSYGCCPYANATCCSDHLHCCPNGYTCDVAHNQCVQQGYASIPMSPKMASNKPKVSVQDVQCQDGSACPDGSTCCQLADGSYGCCPYPNADCCSDKLHCCPSGYTCDLVHSQCVQGFLSIPMSPKLAPTKPAPKANVQDVQCQDGSACPDGSTCCQLADGSYGCCPYPNADCCSDKLHCCPSGYTCDLVHSQCVQQGFASLPLSVKFESKKPKINVEDVPCGDGTSCPDGSTCCQLVDGSYGCCPYANATCCSDHLHCCPNGYTCDVAHNQCVQQGYASIPMSPKMASNKPKADASEYVVCPDKQSACPDGNTCCQLADGSYGCCPYPTADCCSDHLHCCPSGYTCDLADNSCNKSFEKIPAGKKTRSLNLKALLNLN